MYKQQECKTCYNAVVTAGCSASVNAGASKEVRTCFHTQGLCRLNGMVVETIIMDRWFIIVSKID